MKRILASIGRYVGYYLLGIVACILLTPVEVGLIERPLWLLYFPFSVIGYVIFYVDLPPQYVFGSNMTYWTVHVLGLACVALGVAARVLAKGRHRSWSPLLIGLPLGFVGTLGVYYTIAASI